MIITSQFTLNGAPVSAQAPTNRVLVDYLREDLELKGTKISCDQGACGACTVIVNDVPVASCSTFLFELEGAEVVTIERAQVDDAVADALRAAFTRAGAVQCGFCTPGMMIVATCFAQAGETPSREAIREQLAGNWCRCTGYETIIDAIYEAARHRGVSAGPI